MRMPRTATVWIAIATALCWVVAAMLGKSEAAAYSLGFIPARLSGAEVMFPAVPAFLTPLTSTLVHAGLVHLGFNLLILVWCGNQVERVLGSKALVFLYVISAYTAAMLQWAVMPHGDVPVVGASGAISGILGAFALSFGQQKQIVKSRSLNRLINAAWLLAAWVVLQIMTGMLGGFEGVLVATPSHIGGFISGLLLQRPLLMWRYRKA